ncbi:hypothetical protein [Candidatus Erwinia haradaeae]|uniref:hypothetical protein n=1 Tax=Candidatus Erwinia haradaeae TaxID=1922217 RepID=UPI0013001FD6|nr:hypothetical protein [Candidatus Erwinia haradaeae]
MNTYVSLTYRSWLMVHYIDLGYDYFSSSINVVVVLIDVFYAILVIQLHKDSGILLNTEDI